MIVSDKRSYRGSIPLFQSFTRSGYLEITDKERNLVRWVFPMSRLHENERVAMSALLDLVEDEFEPRIILPDRTVADDTSAIGTRTTTGALCIPPYEDIIAKHTISTETVDKDSIYVPSIVFVGPYPAHLTQKDIHTSNVNYSWTKSTDMITIKEKDAILPNYRTGIPIPSEAIESRVSIAHSRLV
jgi:hypothetical protein